MERSTLVGVATGTPDGGVAIVRLSGPRANEVAARLGVGGTPARQLVRRTVVCQPVDGPALADDALVVAMPGPKSFTGEDVVELHIHGGARNVAAVVGACLHAGAASAGPGDFSRRAFENGRLSLDEAEGIAALVGAHTDEALRQARRLASGELGREVDAASTELGRVRADVEGQLDFADEVEVGEVQVWVDSVLRVGATLEDWLLRFDAGRRSREGVRVVLGGPPNAGKSSLFNALLGWPRAIVSPHPGTTRDYVEAQVQLGGVACHLVDTAGLRDGHDEVERIGVERSRDQLDGADLVLWVTASDDLSRPPPPPGSSAPVVEVESKRDLGVGHCDLPGVVLVGPGAGAGLPELRSRLAEEIRRITAHPWIGLARHRLRVEEARQELADATRRLREGALELAAFHLDAAIARLDEIRGRSIHGPVGEAVLAQVFSQFCIGK